MFCTFSSSCACLGTVVLEGMHENKFQGDIFVEFNMTVFWGVAMIFFSHELYFSPGFFFSSGFLFIIQSKLPSWRGWVVFVQDGQINEVLNQRIVSRWCHISSTVNFTVPSPPFSNLQIVLCSYEGACSHTHCLYVDLSVNHPGVIHHGHKIMCEIQEDSQSKKNPL